MVNFGNIYDVFRDFLTGWVVSSGRLASPVVVVAAFISVVLLVFLIDRLEVNTDTENMLSAELPFRKDSIALSEAFPQFSDNILIVLDGQNPDLLDDGADILIGKLHERPELFGDVFYPPGEDYFRHNGLLFFDTEKLAQFVDRVTTAQPFLGTLWRDPSLKALLNLIGLSLSQGSTEQNLLTTARAIDAISKVIEHQSQEQTRFLAWRTLMRGQIPEANELRRFILLQPKLDFDSLQPGGDALNALRTLAEELKLDTTFDIRMRLTGSVPLAHEELDSVIDGMGLAGLVSLALVMLLLTWGLRSGKLVAATLITLIAGLIWTTAFAIATVGALNLISVAFAVLFIGLSVDFGIHFALRYREACEEGSLPLKALAESARSVGGAITLTAVAAAIGFFAFLPTDYRGLAELGLIAGGGMFIALFANLTLLPALLALMPLKVSATTLGAPRGWGVITTRPKTVVILALVVGVAATLVVPRARFDFDPLNLKDHRTESVETAYDLIADPRASPYVITVLASDLAAANALARKLDNHPLVKGTATLDAFLPKNQDSKLEIVESAALLLSAVFTEQGPTGKVSPATNISAIKKIRNELAILRLSDTLDGPLARSVARLDAALVQFVVKPGITASAVIELERRLLATLPRRLISLRDALQADRVSYDDIPPAVRSREIASDGRARLQVFPNEDLRKRNALVRFVKAVREIAPRATGAPVIILEAGHTVIRSFLEAGVISGLLITVMLTILLGRIRGLLLVYLPLILAAVLTVAASVLLAQPFNFANVIVLPLLFGLGVASAIHLIVRSQEEVSRRDVLSTSTPRAVVFSALTTIGSFGTIALSSHPGTASMGLLLTLAIAFTLLSTLVVLPALMRLWPSVSPHQV